MAATRSVEIDLAGVCTRDSYGSGTKATRERLPFSLKCRNRIYSV